MARIRFRIGLSVITFLAALLSSLSAPMPVVAQGPTAQEAINAVENHLVSPVEIVNQPPPDRQLIEEISQ